MDGLRFYVRFNNILVISVRRVGDNNSRLARGRGLGNAVASVCVLNDYSEREEFTEKFMMFNQSAKLNVQ